MTGSPAGATRVTSVDVLRGLVIVVMALDHMRDYVHYITEPTDLATTTVPLFLTRWVTHFCAPVFMLLAGTGAYLQLARGKSRRELAWFLVTRGLWLIVLEVTVVRCTGWFWNVDYGITGLMVIWALGASMIVLAALIWLPRTLLLALCIAGIVGHNLLDGYEPSGSLAWLFRIAHVPGLLVATDGHLLFIGYVLVPWIFVMGLGFAIGPVFTWAPARRTRTLITAGAAMIAAFVVLRALDGYGDPTPWTHQRDAVTTALSFLHCEKYPPSLAYLLMTLGPALLVLGLIERWDDAVARIFRTFGRVPMFFYLLHLPAIHATAVVLALTRYEDVGFLFHDPGPGDAFFPAPPGYGYPLWVVYVAWAVVIAGLYPLCRWYATVKPRHAWLSYL